MNLKVRRTSTEMQKCFLCEKVERESELRQAMTMQLNERLSDGKLLALFSGGDVVALELKYHCSCLTTLDNRERSYIAQKKKDRLQESQENYYFLWSSLNF